MWFLVFLLPLCSCCCQDNNTVWIPNELLVITLEKIHDHLPISVVMEADYQPKRSFAIIAKAILLYATFDVPDIQPAVQELIELLPEPADVIAADPRRDLDILKAIIDQPINDIKRACKATTTAMECADRLQFYQHEQKYICYNYENHIQLRDAAENFVEDIDFRTFLDEVITWCRDKKHGDDRQAVQFFIDSSSKYAELFEKFRRVYEYAFFFDYPCIKFVF